MLCNRYLSYRVWLRSINRITTYHKRIACAFTYYDLPISGPFKVHVHIKTVMGVTEYIILCICFSSFKNQKRLSYCLHRSAIIAFTRLEKDENNEDRLTLGNYRVLPYFRRAIQQRLYPRVFWIPPDLKI